MFFRWRGCRRNAAVRFALPHDLAGGEVDRVDHPAMFDLSAPAARRRSRGRLFGASISPAGMTDVTKMRSPHAIGDDQPWPGIAVFHARSASCSSVSGRFVRLRRRRSIRARETAATLRLSGGLRPGISLGRSSDAPHRSAHARHLAQHDAPWLFRKVFTFGFGQEEAADQARQRRRTCRRSWPRTRGASAAWRPARSW